MTSLQFIGIPHTVVLAQSPALLRPGSRQHANTAPAWLQVDRVLGATMRAGDRRAKEQSSVKQFSKVVLHHPQTIHDVANQLLGELLKPPRFS